MTHYDANTIEELVRAIGGAQEARAVLAFDGETLSWQRLSNWVSKGQVPPVRYMTNNARLQARGINAHPRIWFGDKLPDSARPETAHV